MHHPDGLTNIRSEERSLQRDVANIPAGHLQSRQPGEIETLGWRFERERPTPDLRALGCVRKRKTHDESQPAQKSRIDRALYVGREDCEAAIRFHPLQQVADFHIGVAIVAVLDVTALPEERVGLVEEQDAAALLGCVENATQVLLGLTYVLADDLAQIDAIQIEPQLVREHLGGHGLARAARTGEQRSDPEAALATCCESPLFVNLRTAAYLDCHVV